MKAKVGRPRLERPKDRVELRIDRALLRKAKRIARDQGSPSVNAWLTVLVTRLVRRAADNVPFGSEGRFLCRK